MVTAKEIQAAKESMNAKGVDLPIKDGLDLPEADRGEMDLPDEPTSEEESEMPGVTRPRKGAGWWGRGSSMKAMRKGIPRDFVDGAGLCSPGRWKVNQRILPDDQFARRLRRALRDGLAKAMDQLERSRKDTKLDMKRLLLELAVGKHKVSPFPQEVVEEIRVDLRIICKQTGHGPGLPEEGDVAQAFEVLSSNVY